MFSDNEKKAWQSISAPVSLKDRVMSECEIRPKMSALSPSLVRRYGTLAACLVVVLVLSLALLLPTDDFLSVSLDGSTLSDGSAIDYRYDGVTALSRDSSSYSMLPFDIKGDAEVSADGGELYCQDGGSTLLCEDGRYDVRDEATLIYRVEDLPDTLYTLSVQSDKESFVIEMRYDEDTNSWSVLKTSKD